MKALLEHVCLVTLCVHLHVQALGASNDEGYQTPAPMRVYAQDHILDLIDHSLCASPHFCVRYDGYCHALQDPVSTITDRYFTHSGPPPLKPPVRNHSVVIAEEAVEAAEAATVPSWLNQSKAQDLLQEIWANTTGYGGRGMSREYTYGEVLTEGIQILFDVLPLEPSSVVLDLGSGVGKFTTYTAMTWNISLSWGIEIVHHRYAKSVECVEQLQASFPDVYHSPIRFSVMDFAALHHFGDTTHIYMCSTCFGTELVDRILQVAAATPTVKYIISARALGSTQLNGFSHFVSVRVPCSWSASTTFVIYCRGCSSDDADASPYLSYSSRLANAPSQSASDDDSSRQNRWRHLATMVESQRRQENGDDAGDRVRRVWSQSATDESARAWERHRSSTQGVVVKTEPSPLDQIVSQPWWTCSFLRRRVLSHLFRQNFGCATRAAEFITASRDELMMSFPDLLDYHSYQYVFAWMPPEPCDITKPVQGTDGFTANETADAHVNKLSNVTVEELEQDAAGRIVVSTESPLFVRVLSKAEACFFLGDLCDTAWEGPLTNPKDRGRAQLKSIATNNMIPKQLSNVVRSGKFPTSPVDFIVHALSYPQIVSKEGDDAAPTPDEAQGTDAHSHTPTDPSPKNDNDDFAVQFVNGTLVERTHEHTNKNE